MHDDSPLREFSGVARLFPLPDLVLFPAVVQPLHIFEPRYRQLMADALDDDRLIAMALLQPGWEEVYHDSPAIFPVVCLGRIFQEEKLSDGRYNLLLQGLARARIQEEIDTPRLYRSARVELLQDVSMTSAAEEQGLRKRLGEALHRWYAEQKSVQEQLGTLLTSNLDLGNLCDIFAFALPVETHVKQSLLAELSVAERVGCLLEHLASLDGSLPGTSPIRRFPPEFSSN